MITALPESPSRNDTPEEFVDKADAFVAALPGFVTQANSLATTINTNTTTATTAATTATTKATEAATSAAEAAISLSSATATVGVTKWISGTTYAEGNNVWSPIDFQTYRRKSGGAGATDPSLDTANWELLTTRVAGLNYEQRTSNAQLTEDDAGKLIDITSGTFTQTFAAAASLGGTWTCWIRNSGTGDITLDPNGAETIDGLSSFVMYPGEVRVINCDGTTLRSVVLQPFSKTFTTSDNFIKPPGYRIFEGLAWSAGSSGQKSGATNTLASGGAGGGT